jgi:hypothetical protein
MLPKQHVCLYHYPASFFIIYFLNKLKCTQLLNTACVVGRGAHWSLCVLPASSVHVHYIIKSVYHFLYVVRRIVNVAHHFSAARPGAVSAGRPPQQVCKFFPKCSNTNCHYLHPKVWALSVIWFTKFGKGSRCQGRHRLQPWGECLHASNRRMNGRDQVNANLWQ